MSLKVFFILLEVNKVLLMNKENVSFESQHTLISIYNNCKFILDCTYQSY